MSHSWPFILIIPSPSTIAHMSKSYSRHPFLLGHYYPYPWPHPFIDPPSSCPCDIDPLDSLLPLHNCLVLICHHDSKIWLGYSYTNFSNYSLRTIIMVKTKPSWGSILKKTIRVVDDLICTLFVTRITPHILRLGTRFSNMYCI